MSAKLSQHLGRVLSEAAIEIPEVWVLDADMADSDGAQAFAEAHPERFSMTGIAEQTLISAAAGMAAAGLKPWVFTFSAFLCYRAFDQIRVGVSQARQPVVFVGANAGGLSGRNGQTHTAVNDIALIASLPHIEIYSPADFKDVEYTVERILSSEIAAYVRTPRALFSEEYALPGSPSEMRWLRPMAPIVIVSTGLASCWAIKAAHDLAEAGIDIGVLHLLSLASGPRVADELRQASVLISLEDHSTFGGLGCLLSMWLPDRRVFRLGWPLDFPGKSGADDEVLSAHGLDTKSISQKIQALARDRHW